MKIKTVLFQLAFLLLSSLLFAGSVLESQSGSVQASDKPAQIERASAQQPASLTAQDNHSTRASAHFEPLLLLVMGTTLFFLGSAIKLALSRKLDPKHLGPARKPPSPQC